MNKQELQNEINKTKEHLANIEKMLADYESERWKPQEDNCYYYISELHEIRSAIWHNDLYDKAMHCVYNCFPTREQAEAEAEKILVRRMLEDIARRLNKGEKIDWKGTYQDKYYIYLDTETDELIYGESIWSKDQGTVYCLDQDFLDVAIQETGEERLKKYLRGE